MKLKKTLFRIVKPGVLIFTLLFLFIVKPGHNNPSTSNEIENIHIFDKSSLYSHNNLGNTEKYYSYEYGLSFEYPDTWVLETSTDESSIAMILRRNGYEVRFYLTRDDIEDANGGIVNLDKLDDISYLLDSEKGYILIDKLSPNYVIPYSFGGIYYINTLEENRAFTRNAFFNGKYSIIVNYGTSGTLSKEIENEMYFIITNIDVDV